MLMVALRRCLQAYISGHALVILGGPQTLLQTIYVDDIEKLEAVAFDEASGKIAVCGGPDIFIYQPYGIQGETLKVCNRLATSELSRLRDKVAGNWKSTYTNEYWLFSGPLPVHFARKMTTNRFIPCRGGRRTSCWLVTRALRCGC
jgi:hypothetical protein